jgi:hypothetical protein
MIIARNTRRRLLRLARMDWREAGFRLRQTLGNRWDYLCCYRLGLTTDLTPLPAKAVPESAQFFVSQDELLEIAASIRAFMPQAAEETIEQAQRICAHRFDLLGFENLDFGDPIDWHFDPVHNKRAPLRPWYQIPFLNPEAVGDSKIIWELNRHQHWTLLGRAYQFSRREIYAQEFARQFYCWRRQNPYPMGINWSSALEVAMRSLSWLWARELFRRSSVMNAELGRDLLIGLGRNARFLERNLSLYFSPNTHLIGEAVALFSIGVLCPQLPERARWQQLGWSTILRCAAEQVRADGAYSEQSTYYHVYALDFFLHARILALRNHLAIPIEFDQTLRAMLNYLTALCAHGPAPTLGDDDGGRVFDPRRNRAEHLRDPLAVGAVLFQESAWAAAAQGPTEEVVWLLGPSAARNCFTLAKLGQKEPAREFKESGTYILSAGVSSLIMDAGPLGSGRGGHGHADALSLCLNVNGQSCLQDSGTFSYTGEPEWRDHFRGTAAHNTVAIDGKDQIESQGPFAWQRLDYARVERCIWGETFDLLEASHDGYRRLASPVIHRRLVFFVKPSLWLVTDKLGGEGTHDIEINWHLANNRVQQDGADRFIVTARSERFQIVLLRKSGWSTAVLDSWHSPAYGCKHPATCVRVAAAASLPAEYATVLACGTVSRASLEASAGRAARGYRYVCDSREHNWFFSDTCQDWEVAGFSSDAEIAYCELSDGELRHVVLCNARYLKVAGREVVRAEQRAGRLEITMDGGTERICCSEPVAIHANLAAAVPCPSGKARI